MLLSDIITLLNESFRNAHVTDDERVDRRLIQDWIMIQRNVFIKNYLNQNGTLEQNTLQFEELDIEDYDPALVISGVSLGNKVIRTDVCPQLIEGRSGVAVYELTSPDIMSKTIQLVSMDRLRWCGNGKVNRNFVFAAFYDGRFYLTSKTGVEKGMTKLRVVGVFADPTLVSTYSDTEDYPVNGYMISYMKNAVMQEDFSFTNQTKTDVINNANGEVQTSS